MLVFFGALFGFLSLVFMFILRKDEPYLKRMAVQIQDNRKGLKRIDDEFNNLQFKIEFIERVCKVMRKELIEEPSSRAKDKAYEKINRNLSSDLTKIQQEITDLRELISLDKEDY